MASNNEREIRKDILSALGVSTADAQTEKTFGRGVAQGLRATNTKTKPAIVALTNASTNHTVNATFSNTEVKAALDALGTRINAVIAALKA